MDVNALSRHNPIFAECAFRSTLYAVSAPKSDGCSDSRQVSHVLSEEYASSLLECLDFDAIKRALYSPRPEGNSPCSVDALFFAHNGTALIEFKSETATVDNIIRKVYDSVILLIEHDGYDFPRARKELTYLIVSTGIENRITGSHRSLGRAKAYCREPWRQFRKQDDHWKTSALEGIIVKEAYGMHPATFDYYAKLKGWK